MCTIGSEDTEVRKLEGPVKLKKGLAAEFEELGGPTAKHGGRLRWWRGRRRERRMGEVRRRREAFWPCGSLKDVSSFRRREWINND